MRTATLIFFGVWLVAPWLWNAFILWQGAKEATISCVVVATGQRYPILIVLLGLYAGLALAHWWFPLEADR